MLTKVTIRSTVALLLLTSVVVILTSWYHLGQQKRGANSHPVTSSSSSSSASSPSQSQYQQKLLSHKLLQYSVSSLSAADDDDDDGDVDKSERNEVETKVYDSGSEGNYTHTITLFNQSENFLRNEEDYDSEDDEMDYGNEVEYPADGALPNHSISQHTSYISYSHLQLHASSCNMSSLRSWKRGLVTELRPRISADCDLLRQDNRAEIEQVKRKLHSWQNSESEEEWRESLSDCAKVVEDFSSNFYNSPTEVNFPLAYILVVYTNPRQMVRLIKTLWRPQNLFCIHPDAKQSEEFINVFRQLAKCLDNVFLPKKLEKVYYQHHSIMDSQMNCYEELVRYPAMRWKYVINLCGRELPLKTNREIVESLRKLKGHSVIESQHIHTESKHHVAMTRLQWKAVEDYDVGKLHMTRERLEKPPISIYKSTNFIAATRPFVKFFLTNKKAIAFRKYLRDVKIPEEEFYASLIHLPGVPGGLPQKNTPLPTIDKYIWMNKWKKTRSKKESCEGEMVHFICILSSGDLDQVFRWGVSRQTPIFFFNKYFMEKDHVVMDCMEEWLIRQNMKEYEADCSHKQYS